MHRKTWITVCLLFALVAGLAECAQAQRRGGLFRRRANEHNNNYQNNVWQGPNWPAAKIDSASASYRPLSIAYGYDEAMSPDVAFTDKIRVFLRVADSTVLAAGQDLVAEIKIADLSDYDNSRVRYVPVSILGQREHDTDVTLATVELGNDDRDEDDAKKEDADQPLVQAAHVYRLFINLHKRSAEYSDQTVLGRIPSPYYVSTSGDTPLQRARRQIVMRTFKEWYYTEWGWWSTKQYVMDCYAFYMWATGFCTVGADYGHTRLDRLFAGGIPYHVGAHIPQLSSEGAIHGDYVRIPDHSLMILAYDPDKHHVVTMEGNYNSSLEIVVRPVAGDWTVGHLVAEHIRADMFGRGLRDEMASADQLRLLNL